MTLRHNELNILLLKTKLILTAFAVTLLIAQSCNKNISTEPEFYTDPTSLVNVSNYGWLQFDDPDHLNSVLEQLTKSDSAYEANHDSWIGSIDDSYTQEQIDSIFEVNNYTPDYIYTSFENNQTGFVSLRHQYDFLEDAYLASLQIGESINADNYPDHALNFTGLNSIVNSKGEYQVGDYVVFTFPEEEGNFVIHIDSINDSNIDFIRNIEFSDFSNFTITDTLYPNDPINQSILQGTNEAGVFIQYKTEDSQGNDFYLTYIFTILNDWANGTNSEDCRTKHRKKDNVSITGHEFYCVTRFGRHLFFGHNSHAKIVHHEIINGKRKKARADLGLKTVNPYLYVSENCKTGQIKTDKDFPNYCSPSNINCYGSDFKKEFSHRTTMPMDPTHVANGYSASNNNDTKIRNNTRYTKFYFEGNVILTLYNKW